MTAYTRNMIQEATYWAPSGNDGFGRSGYASPVVIMCRWENRNRLLRRADGADVTTSADVFVDRALVVKGYLVLGDVTAESDADDPVAMGAREILEAHSTPSLRGNLTLNKVLLK